MKIKSFGMFKLVEGWTKPKKLSPDWEVPGKEVLEFIKDFFIEMIDEGFEVKIEELITEDDFRYSIECSQKLELTKNTEEWYKKYIIDCGKIFHDSSVTLKSHTNGIIHKILLIDGQKEVQYFLMIRMSDPIL